MADFVHDDGPADDSRGSATRRIVNLAGAAVSTALVLGMGVWGYKLMVRDVSGIPVIEAIDGAFRTQPEEPGGLQAPHQGLQVNEIAAGGTAGETAEEVRLAPDPQDLASEDEPMGELTPAAPLPAEDELASVPAPGNDPDVPEIAATDAEEGEDPAPARGTDLAVAEAMAALGAGPAGEVGDPAALASRPAPRPDEAPTAPAAGTPSVGAGEVEIAALAEGTRLVQLGAFESPEVARAHWQDVGARFADAFAGKRMVLQEAMSGGQPFYRLRAEGFENLAAAESFCARLLSGQADCIPVAVR